VCPGFRLRRGVQAAIELGEFCIGYGWTDLVFRGFRSGFVIFFMVRLDVPLVV
jgi:hypothetical protein